MGSNVPEVVRWAKGEGLSREEVDAAVVEILQGLRRRGKARLTGLGVLRYDGVETTLCPVRGKKVAGKGKSRGKAR